MKEEYINEIEFNEILVGFGNAGLLSGRHGKVIEVNVSYGLANHMQQDYVRIWPDGRYDSMGLGFRIVPSAGTQGIHLA